jgi:hypothetical protein
MRFFSALLALSLIGTVLGKPVPVKQEGKRLLGLDNLLGCDSSSGSGSASTTDLAGLLYQMNADLITSSSQVSYTRDGGLTVRDHHPISCMEFEVETRILSKAYWAISRVR